MLRDVAPEDVDGLAPDALCAVVGDPFEGSDEELPHLGAVFEEEEEDDRHHPEARADLGDGADSAERSRSELGAREEAADLFRDVVQLPLVG